MPRYFFECKECGFEIDKTMSIGAYKKFKEENECSECDTGVLLQRLSPVRNKIERKKEEIVAQIEEDVRKTLKKIESGDERTIRDIYGDKANTLK